MRIWQRDISLTILNQRAENTLASHLGIVFTEIGDDTLTATMPVDSRTQQPLGILNGGASCALAETLGSTAANFCVDDTQYCVGLDINANHLRAAQQGMVSAQAKAFHLGKRTQVWHIEIHQEARMVAVARLTMAVLSQHPI